MVESKKTAKKPTRKKLVDAIKFDPIAILEKKKKIQEKQDTNFVEQTQFFYCDLIPVSLATEFIKKDLCDSLTPIDFQTSLAQVVQDSIQYSRSVPEEYAEYEPKFTKIELLRQQVHSNHYNGCVKVGILLHFLLNDIFKLTGDIEVVTQKIVLERVFLQYNRYDPYSMLLYEENGLHTLNLIQRGIKVVRKYLQTKGYDKRLKIINLKDLTDDDIEDYDTEAETVLLSQDSALNKIIFTFGDHDYTINMNASQEYKTTLNQIGNILDKAIGYGKTLIRHVKDYAKEIDFDLGKNSFSDGPMSNQDAMRQIQLYPILSDKQFIFKPKMFIKRISKFQSIRYGPPEKGIVRAIKFMHAGEVRQVEEKVLEMIKRGEYKTDSILDSYNEESADEISREINQEKERNNSEASESEKYLDTSQNVNTHFGINAQAGIKAEIKTVDVTLDVGVDYTKDKATLEAMGMNSVVSKSTETNARKMDKCVSSHVQKKSAERSKATNKTLEESQETQKETKIRSEFQNPNKISPLNYYIYDTYQKFITIHSIQEIHLIYSNGTKLIEMDISDAYHFFNSIFRIDPNNENLKKYRKFLENLIIQACTVKDYQKREICLLQQNQLVSKDSKDSNQLMDVEFLLKPYFEYDGVPKPKTTKTKNDEQDTIKKDVLLKNIQDIVYGIVTHVSIKQIQTMAYQIHSEHGESTLDTYAELEFVVKLIKEYAESLEKIAKTEQITGQTDTLYYLIDLIHDIVDDKTRSAVWYPCIKE